jgi:mRNA-degrading endonuclease RelE of RelBE toxin-antitoxin system
MRFEIVLAPGASRAFRALPAHIRSRVRDALERHLRFGPTKVGKSRIKRLRGMSRPQYRLRGDDIRVFYDVTQTTVDVLAIVRKSEAQAWLDQEGTPDPHRSSGEG